MNKMSKVKPCFGFLENLDSSWHCKGCIVKYECRIEMKQNKERGIKDGKGK